MIDFEGVSRDPGIIPYLICPGISWWGSYTIKATEPEIVCVTQI